MASKPGRSPGSRAICAGRHGGRRRCGSRCRGCWWSASLRIFRRPLPLAAPPFPGRLMVDVAADSGPHRIVTWPVPHRRAAGYGLSPAARVPARLRRRAGRHAARRPRGCPGGSRTCQGLGWRQPGQPPATSSARRGRRCHRRRCPARHRGRDDPEPGSIARERPAAAGIRGYARPIGGGELASPRQLPPRAIWEAGADPLVPGPAGLLPQVAVLLAGSAWY